METLWIIIVGSLFTAGVYLMMERHILRILFGIVLLSNAINLALFLTGKLTFAAPPFIGANEEKAVDVANSVPQALVLTAIVIGFGLLIFALILTYRVYKEAKTVDIDLLLKEEFTNDK